MRPARPRAVKRRREESLESSEAGDSVDKGAARGEAVTRAHAAKRTRGASADAATGDAMSDTGAKDAEKAGEVKKEDDVDVELEISTPRPRAPSDSRVVDDVLERGADESPEVTEVSTSGAAAGEGESKGDDDSETGRGKRSPVTDIVPYFYGNSMALIRSFAFIHAEGGEGGDRRATSEVSSFGRGDLGQLMLNSDVNQLVPAVVEKLNRRTNIVALAAGAFHTLAVTETGELFAAGCNDEGQLFQGEDEAEAYVLQPTLVETMSTQQVLQVSAGSAHTAVVTDKGIALSFGSNEFGQLGHSVGKAYRAPPRMIRGLAGHTVVQVACGATHTLVLTRTGAVFSVGCGAQGVLGHGDRENRSDATRVEALAAVPVGQIAAGDTHSLAVTVSGMVYSWGRNKHGQCGIPTRDFPHATNVPCRVRGLPEPIQYAAGGGMHSAFVARYSGHVYTCGRNSSGQLGLGDRKDVDAPQRVRGELEGHAIREVALGARHSVFLTTEGAVFTSGAGSDGQLGTGKTDDTMAPVRVAGYDGQGAFHITAGGDHTLVLRVKSGSVLSRPPGCLPVAALLNVDAPTLLFTARDAAASQNFSPLKRMLTDVYGNASALNASFLTSGSEVLFYTMTAPPPATSDAIVPKTTIKLVLASSDGAVVSESDLVTSAGGGGGRGAGETHGSGHEASQDALEGTLDGLLATSGVAVNDLEQAHIAVLGSYNTELAMCWSRAIQQVLAELEKSTASLSEPDAIRAILVLLLVPLHSSASRFPTLLPRICGVINNMPKAGRDMLIRWIFADVPKELIASRIVRPLQAHLSLAVQRLISSFNPMAPGAHVRASTLADRRSTAGLVHVLQLLFVANDAANGKGIDYQEFYNSVIDTLDPRVLQYDYGLWRNRGAKAGVAPRAYPVGVAVGNVGDDEPFDLDGSGSSNSGSSAQGSAAGGAGGPPSGAAGAAGGAAPAATASSSGGADSPSKGDASTLSGAPPLGSLPEDALPFGFLFTEHPFLLNADQKRLILQLEAQLQMSDVVRNAQYRMLFGESPFLVLKVDRKNIVEHALNQVAIRQPTDLKKPLKVVFEGEEGVDEGGVTKDFFQTLIRRLFDLDYSMFTYEEETRMYWFNPATMVDANEFRLIGLICGLAIYNRVLLDVHFPLFAWKKMLGLKVGLKELASWQPMLAKGLQDLLDYPDPDVEDVFCLSFSTTVEAFGETKVIDLVPGGREKAVTNENRQEYVDRYVDWLLNESVKDQFTAFMKGFCTVVDGPALHLFRAEELELLVCGTPQLDFKELQKAAQYEGGFSADHPQVKALWEMVHAWPQKLKSKFLLFVTGSSKAPIGGLGKITPPLKIQRNGVDDTRLPSSATCFNILLLPEYSSPEVMRRQLELAIVETEGFGLQ